MTNSFAHFFEALMVLEDKMLYFMNELIDEGINGFDDKKIELEQKICCDVWSRSAKRDVSARHIRG